MSTPQPAFHYVTERVVSERPFTVRRRVKWGNTDAAGVVYTPRFADFVVETNEMFSAWLLGGPACLKRAEAGFGMPVKALSLEFNRGLWPDDEVDITVRVLELRTRTFDVAIDGWTPEGENVFRSRLTPIMLAGERDRRSIPIPEFLRVKLEAYRGQNPPAAAQVE